MTLVTSLAVVAATLGVFVVVADAKPTRVLATLAFTVPPDAKAGDEVTTTLRLTALVDVDELAVSVLERSGLTIVSQPYGATFTDVRAGTTREFEVHVRLNDEKAVLQVRYETRSKAYGTASENRLIEYGEPK